MTKVSVLTPLYNPPERYLREMIDSVLNQTLTDFEFIILNDCPHDIRSEEIVLSYHDNRILYLKNDTNLGIAQSRNKLIDLAKSDYLAVVDHDDISLPSRLQKEADFLDNHPECGVVSSWYRKIYGKRHLVRTRPETNAEILSLMSKKCAVIHPAAMLRKSVLNQFHIRYEQQFSPAEDYALFAQLVGKTQFYNLQETLLLYRNFNGNTSHQKQRQMRENNAKIKKLIERKRLYKDEILRQIHALDDDLRILIRKEQALILSKRKEKIYDNISIWNLWLNKLGGYLMLQKELITGLFGIGLLNSSDNGLDGEKWKKMLNFRL